VAAVRSTENGYPPPDPGGVSDTIFLIKPHHHLDDDGIKYLNPDDETPRQDRGQKHETI